MGFIKNVNLVAGYLENLGVNYTGGDLPSGEGLPVGSWFIGPDGIVRIWGGSSWNTDIAGNSGGSGDSGSSDDLGSSDGSGNPQNPFANISIIRRGEVIDGYTITYNPAMVKIVTEPEQYTVTALVTYNATGAMKSFSFLEWAYPQDATIDSYGRAFIPMDTLPDGECKDLLISTGERVVASKGDETDEMVISAYSEVLGRGFLSSGTFQYWTAVVDNNIWDLDTLKIAVANAAKSTDSCPLAKENALGYLASLDNSITRTIVPMASVPAGDCKAFVAAHNDTFVLSNGSINDEMIKEVYETVLDRLYISNSAYDYWGDLITSNNWSLSTLRMAVANAAISSSYCNAARYNAYIYLNPVTSEGRAYIKMTQIDTSGANGECYNVAIQAANFDNIYVLPLSNDNIDARIFKAYKDVLGRDYISNNAIKYWHNDILTNNWTDTEFYTAIKQAASSEANCPIAKANANNYNLSNIANTAYFDGIEIVSRDMSIKGYSISYTPMKPPEVTEAGYSTVNAVVTHIASGATKAYTFEEYLYPTNSNSDRYGRDIIALSDITNAEYKNYAINTGIVFVSPRLDSDDTRISDLFTSSTKVSLVSSEDFEYWVNYSKDNSDISDEELELLIINKFIPKHASCINAILNTRYRKASLLGETTRPRIDHYSLPDDACKHAIFSRGEFAADAQQDNDTEALIKTSYSTVLGRGFLSNTAYAYWHNDIEVNNYTPDDFKSVLATAALSDDSPCVVAKSYAYKYLNPVDPYNRAYITYDLVPSTGADGECKTSNIARNSIAFLYVEFDDTDAIDVKIKNAYEEVLGRDYITSSALHYWTDYLINNEGISYCDFKAVIARGAIANPQDCPIAKANAQNYIDTKLQYCGIDSLDIFNDNSGVSLFQLDDSFIDLGGLATPTWYGTESYDIGKFGDAAEFDGASGVEMQHQEFNNIQKHLSLWLKLNDNTSDRQQIVGIDQDDAGWSNMNIFVEDGKLGIGGRSGDHDDASYETLYTSSIDIALNTWYHIVLTKDESTNDYSVYLNNVVDDTFNFTFYIPTNSYRQTIGVFKNDSDDSENRHFLRGFIDQIRIFNRQLTSEDVDILYNANN